MVKLSGHFRRLSHDSPRPGSVTDDDHDDLSIKSGHCKSSNNANSGQFYPQIYTRVEISGLISKFPSKQLCKFLKIESKDKKKALFLWGLMIGWMLYILTSKQVLGDLVIICFLEFFSCLQLKA